MKIVNEPPRDGSQFIVNWFDDGIAKASVLRYQKDSEMFEFRVNGDIWYELSPVKESTYFNDKLIIVESE